MIIDAGVGTASDAAVAMELGADGVLMNTAIAEAQDTVLMAEAMRHAVEAGRGGVSRRPDSEEALRQCVEPPGRRGAVARRAEYVLWRTRPSSALPSSTGSAALPASACSRPTATIPGSAQALRHTSLFQWSQLGGTLPAPLFLFAAGISVALVTGKALEKGVPAGEAARGTMLRGAQVVGFGLLFRVQEFLLGQPYAPWTDLLRVDVLNIIGVSIILMGMMCGLAGWE